MKILIVNTDYVKFLRWFYRQRKDLAHLSYEDQLEQRQRSLFGVCDYYSFNLKKLGQEAWEVYPNNPHLNKMWRQPLKKIRGDSFLKRVFRRFYSVDYDTLQSQIDYYRPHVLLNQDMASIDLEFLQQFKGQIPLIVGQHAATALEENKEWGVYDLVLSSFPPTVKWFQKKGIPCQLHRLGFEERLLKEIPENDRKEKVTFIGSFGKVHSSRVRFLEKVIEQIEFDIWAPDMDSWLGNSPLRKRYRGQAWGRGMYSILKGSKITLNHHGDVAPYANNMRLFEATGMGTLLITDWKENLKDMFVIDEEIVTYKSWQECVEKVRFYLAHEEERRKIAEAGQRRTLKEHSYFLRMKELVVLLKPYLRESI